MSAEKTEETEVELRKNGIGSGPVRERDLEFPGPVYSRLVGAVSTRTVVLFNKRGSPFVSGSSQVS